MSAIPTARSPLASDHSAYAPKPKDNIAIGYLRAFVTLLVLAHHSVLAYHPDAPPLTASLTAQPRWWQAFPVVDSRHWTGFSLFVGFNDIFFMSLMFFLSGLFVWNSLRRKGSRHFFRDRAIRLGLPFLAAAAIIAPLAYYPAYLQRTAHPDFAGFWRQWLSLGNWPAGPAWFVWLLLGFDCIAVLLFLPLPQWGETLGRLLAGASRRPAVFFALFAALSAAAYIPMALAFGPYSWTAFGPFTFQTSRILHYLLYFLIAVGLGALGIDRGLLAPDGKLARRWPLWVVTSLVFFIAIMAIVIAAVTPASAASLSPRAWVVTGGFVFALSCAASCFACLAIFVRFAKKRRRIFDSLRDNAYGMYLIHYAFVSWIQYSLLNAPLSGFVKGILVTVSTVAASWITVAALRRLPAIARVI